MPRFVVFVPQFELVHQYNTKIRSKIVPQFSESCHDYSTTPIFQHLRFVSQILQLVPQFFQEYKHQILSQNSTKNILSMKEAMSVQALSLLKSEIYCCRNVSQTHQISITNILGVQVILGTYHW